MKGPEHILEWRRRTGTDRFDEMWEGVLHMTPSPSLEHQGLAFKLAMWLCQYWAEPTGSQVHMQINVAEPGTWPDNYRIPDVVLITPERLTICRQNYLDGGPDAVVEVRSPDDESYDKLDFYVKIGVREVWTIDGESKLPEILEYTGDELQVRSPNAESWVQSDVAGTEMRAEEDKLAIRLVQRPETLERLP